MLKSSFDTEGEAVRSAFIPVVAEARESVAVVMLEDEAVALGMIVSADGLLLTKASELADDRPVFVELADGRTLEAARVASDRRADLALLKVDAQGLRPMELAVEATLEVGQWAVVPGQDALPEAVGVVSALPRRVSGVRLGVAMTDTPRGPMIGRTMPGMGAAEAGLERGDVIVSINGTPVADSEAVIAAVENYDVGDILTLVVEREDQRQSFDIDLRLMEIDKHSRLHWMNTMGNEVSRRRDGFTSVLQHDAALEPRQCGGPLLDLDGRCIGINIARAGRIESFALPASVVAEALALMRRQMMVP